MTASPYKKYALLILGMFIFLHGLSVVWLYHGYFNPQRNSFWINTLYEKKEAFAQSVQSSKIVIVSGSSGLFGISAAQIESYFKIPAVNLSTHAGLRDYYLERAKKSIKPGDLVLFAPEYDQYFYDFVMSEVKSDYIVNYDKAALKSLPWDEQMEILTSYAHPWKLMKTVVKDIRSRRSKKEASGYNAKNLNANGDETSNHGTQPKTFEPIPMNRRFDANAYGMRKTTGFLDWCRRKGAEIIVTWPGTLPFKNTPKTGNTDFIGSLIAFLSNEGIEVLGKPEDFFVPENYLFDTIYHLNADGVYHRTAATIRFLEKSPTFSSWREKNTGSFDPVETAFHPPQMENICVNGSIEKSANNRPLGWKPVMGKKTDGTATWDNSAAHGGNYSLKLENTSSGQVRWIGEKVLLPPGVHRIHAGGWSKSENVEAQARYCINLKTFFRDGSTRWNARGLIFPAGTHDWVQAQTVLVSDAEIMAVQPFLMLHEGKGTAWFDDIFIRIPENNPPPG